MDMFAIAGAFWRHKLLTLPLLFLTLLGVVYVVKIKPPTYQATSSFLLSNPPAPPTAAQIAADPKLGKINPNNPFANYGNLSIAASVLVNYVTTPATQRALIREGANPGYQITPDTEYGFTAPILQITGTGHTPQAAIGTADLVTTKAESLLYQMQKDQGVNSQYMINPIQVTMPQQAQQSASGKLRELIAVLGLGIVMIFLAISTADATDKRRRRVPDRSAAPRAADDNPVHDIGRLEPRAVFKTRTIPYRPHSGQSGLRH